MHSGLLKRTCKLIISAVVVITVFGQTRTECPVTVHRDVKGFGPGCKYRCNCVNNEQCDNVTGECPSGCLRGWMGPGCQYRNYAIEQSAKQYYVSRATSKLASRAIDGNESTCSKTASKGPLGYSTQQWWQVEFNHALYLVGLIIKIPVSETARFKGFSVQVGNTTGINVTCYDHGTNESIEPVTEINCLQPVVGNTLRILLAGTVDAPLVLCEVEVYGGRLVSFNMPTQVDDVIEAPPGLLWNSSYAVDGKQIFDWKIETIPPKKTCSGMGGRGYKPGQETAWWKVELGAIFCIHGFDFYGILDISSDQYRTFTVMSGYKHSQDYQKLFTEDRNLTGNMTFYDPKTKTLPVPVFGDIVRVEASYKSAVVLCELNVFAECPIGKCGWDCSITCMCISQTTGHSKIQGTCPYGCSERWTGLQQKCDNHCSDTEWGPFCNMTCGQCKGKHECSVTDGTCPNTCEPGWKPPLCVDGCDKGTYGDSCNESCGYCQAGTPCNHVTGVCLDGCEAGYHLQLCKTKCSNGRWGPNCESECGNCENSTACNIYTGNCSGACKPGLLPPLCINAKSLASERDDRFYSLGIIVGPIVAVSVVIVVIIGLLIVWRRKSRTSETSLYANYNVSATDVHDYETLGSRRETQHVYDTVTACKE